MKNITSSYYLLFLLSLLMLGCIKEYLPQAITAHNNFLVVDGIINATRDSPTVITLSRTRNLTDTVTITPEMDATVFVQNELGASFLLNHRGNGEYINPSIPVDLSLKYRLMIRTADGKEYQSDYVNSLQTPEIDSLNWSRDNELTKSVTIFVNTHDAQNSIRYYRWDFIETWEYTAKYESFLGIRNGQVFFRNPPDLITTCWSFSRSFDILLGSSIKLSDDVISEAPIAIIPDSSVKLGVKYSILARQYALDQKAYEYWQVLKKNSEELGSLFDAQPSQLKGNIHCTTNPNEPVIGFISASTITEKRLFISKREVGVWNVLDYGILCFELKTSRDSADYYNKKSNLAPYYFFSGGISLAPEECLDCRMKGGTNIKPSFWR